MLFSKEKFDAVLIGDSVVRATRLRIMEELRELNPEIPIIYVYADVTRNDEPLADECVDVSGDPEPLLNAIKRQINRTLRRAA